MTRSGYSWLAYDGQGAWMSKEVFLTEEDREVGLQKWLTGVLEYEPFRGTKTKDTWDLLSLVNAGLYAKSKEYTQMHLEKVGESPEDYLLYTSVEEAELQLLIEIAEKLGTFVQRRTVWVHAN